MTRPVIGPNGTALIEHFLADRPDLCAGQLTTAGLSEEYRTAGLRAFSLTFSITQRDASASTQSEQREGLETVVVEVPSCCGRTARPWRQDLA